MRLDAKGLASAKALLEAYKPRVADKAANDVATPATGWDASEPRPTTSSAPPARTLPKGKVTSL